MRSPYTVLGVHRTARADDIKSAYRQLAKTWHPDQNRENPQAGSRFAEIAHAYKLLIDPELRLKFDKGEIDARGRRKARPAPGFSTNPFNAFKQAMKAATGAGNTNSADASEDLDEATFEDMVTHIFGEAAAKQSKKKAAGTPGSTGRRTEPNAPGMDEDPLDALDALFEKWKTRHKPKSGLPTSRHQVNISIETAFAGHQGEVTLANGMKATYAAPPGAVDGTEIRVPSPDPATCGDAIVTLRHEPHPRFRASGVDIHADHPIDLSEAVLGGSFVFQGLDGPLRIAIPEWSGSATVLRVGDKGLPTANGRRGALHVHLRVMLPEKPDKQLIELMRSGRKSWFV